MENSRSLESLSFAELEALLSRQIDLHKSLFYRLPDSGGKLLKSIEKIKSILAEKKVCTSIKDTERYMLSNEQTKVTQELLRSTLKPQENNTVNNVDINLEDNYIDTLSNDLSNISVNLSNCDVTDSESYVNCDSIPCISLDEYTSIRQSLNLPCSYTLSSFRWFTFAIRFVDNLVYLSVVDCRDPNRNLLRVGLAKTWFPGWDSFNTKFIPDENVQIKKISLCQPTHALHDLWLFLSTGTNQNTIVLPNKEVYCLICYPLNNNNNNPDDIICLSRLIRSTRHSNIVRSIQPCDCYFTNAQYALITIVSNGCNDNNLDKIVHFMNDMKKRTNNELSINNNNNNNNNDNNNINNKVTTFTNDITVIGEQFIKECCKLSELLFYQSPTDDNINKTQSIKLRYFSTPMDYLKLSKVKTMIWMEAPMELYLLRQLKSACSIMADKSTLTPAKNLLNDLNKIPDEILRRLALVGLGRTRLIRLSGLGGWKGFAGFLAFRPSPTISQNITTTSYTINNNSNGKAFVTDDLEVIRILFAYFRNVYMHLDRHEKCYVENNTNYSQQIKPFKSHLSNKLGNPLLLSNIDYFNDTKTQFSSNNNNDKNDHYNQLYHEKIQAWTSSGNQVYDPFGHRQLCRLSMEQSMDLMKKVQVNYENCRIKYKLPSYPSMPTEVAKLNRYRDPSVLLMKEMGSSSSSSSTSSDAEDSDSGGDDSLRLEDVD